MVNSRSSNIEFMKVIAMILIILSHSIINDSLIPLNIFERNLMNFFRYLGQVGNCMFIFCSAWFLCDKKNIKLRKVIYLLLDSTIALLIVFSIFFFLSLIPSFKVIIHSFPLLSSYNWFIRTYCMFYLIVPFLNIIVANIDKNKHFWTLVFLVLLYSFGNMLKYGLYYYNQVIGFIVIYFFASYIKKYNMNFIANERNNILYIILGIICSILIIFLPIPIDNLGIFFVNPFILIIVSGIFGILDKYDDFKSRSINYLSSLSLLIYVFHENYYIDAYYKGNMFIYLDKIIDNNIVLLICYFLILFLVSLLLSVVYKSILCGVVHRMIDIVISFFDNVYYKKYVK